MLARWFDLNRPVTAYEVSEAEHAIVTHNEKCPQFNDPEIEAMHAAVARHNFRFQDGPALRESRPFSCHVSEVDMGSRSFRVRAIAPIDAARVRDLLFWVSRIRGERPQWNEPASVLHLVGEEIEVRMETDPAMTKCVLVLQHAGLPFLAGVKASPLSVVLDLRDRGIIKGLVRGIGWDRDDPDKVRWF